ncbi:elongation factor Ts [bacterium]|nr:elongation factor Ts [bacterium]
MVDIKDIQKLREQTQAPIMECKKALEEAQGDLEKAKLILKKKGELRAEKKQAEETKEGIIEAYIHSNKKVGVLVELRSQTDFVSLTAEFQELAHNIAMHIAAMNPRYISPDDIPTEEIERMKKEYSEELQGSNKPPEIIEKIVQGKLEKELQEVCLLKQPYIKDENKTIGDLLTEATAKFGEKIEVKRFVRFQI